MLKNGYFFSHENGCARSPHCFGVQGKTPFVGPALVTMSEAEPQEPRTFYQLFRFQDGTIKRIEMNESQTVRDVCEMPEVRHMAACLAACLTQRI
jgi:hypothetical protein